MCGNGSKGTCILAWQLLQASLFGYAMAKKMTPTFQSDPIFTCYLDL